MKVAEVRELDVSQLEQRLADTRRELFNLRFQHATGQLENTSRMGQAKRDLARGLTIARQRGLDVEAELRRLRESA